MPDPALDKAEPRVVCGQDEITLRDESHRCAKAKAVDSDDHRLANAPHDFVEANDFHIEYLIFPSGIRRCFSANPAEIATGAECPAVGADQNATDRVVLAGKSERAGDLVTAGAKSDTEGVQLLWPVQDHMRDVVRHLVQNMVVAAGHLISLSNRTQMAT